MFRLRNFKIFSRAICTADDSLSINWASEFYLIKLGTYIVDYGFISLIEVSFTEAFKSLNIFSIWV
jgi:hypothetical protein